MLTVAPQPPGRVKLSQLLLHVVQDLHGVPLFVRLDPVTFANCGEEDTRVSWGTQEMGPRVFSQVETTSPRVAAPFGVPRHLYLYTQDPLITGALGTGDQQVETEFCSGTC